MKILSLDGGGINGLLQASILDQLKINPADYDLIAGTSVGAINAAGLRIGMTPLELMSLYVVHGREIFPPYWKRAITGRPLAGLIRAKYSNGPIKQILRQYFKDELIGNVDKPLIVCAADQVDGDFVVIKSYEHYSMLLREAILASASAPVYFPSDGRYIDGGIAANHPGDVAVAEAIRKFGAKISDIEITSVGTGYSYDAPKWYEEGLGALPFGLQALEMIMRTQVRKTHQTLRRILGPKYKRYNAEYRKASGKMDDASEDNINALLSDSAQFTEEV